MELDRQRIDELVSAVADCLEGDWLLVGGALVALWLTPRRVTENVDLIGIGEAVAQRSKLLGLAWDLGLPIETMNSAADFFVERIEGWRKEMEVFRKGAKGTILRPSPTLFLLLKLGRLSEQDLEDCLALIELARRTGLPMDQRRLSSAIAGLPVTDDAELNGRRRRLQDALQA